MPKMRQSMSALGIATMQQDKLRELKSGTPRILCSKSVQKVTHELSVSQSTVANLFGNFALRIPYFSSTMSDIFNFLLKPLD